MSYRDDHDAAIARLEVLEAELRRAHREHDRLRAEIARLRAPRPQPPPLAAARRPPLRGPGPGVLLVQVAVAIVGISVGVIAASHARISDRSHRGPAAGKPAAQRVRPVAEQPQPDVRPDARPDARSDDPCAPAALAGQLFEHPD